MILSCLLPTLWRAASNWLKAARYYFLLDRFSASVVLIVTNADRARACRYATVAIRVFVVPIAGPDRVRWPVSALRQRRQRPNRDRRHHGHHPMDSASP